MDQFINIIKTALTSTDNNTRSNAEGQIINYRDSNPTQFFLDCSIIVQDEKYDIFTRQSAGTVASRLLNMKVIVQLWQNMNNGKFYWDEVNMQQKQTIKNNVLSVLISPLADVMKAGANILAVIASIELPRGQWEEIIDLLAQHCTNEDPNVKMASITTLGYICEQIKNSGQLINDRLSQQILGSIIFGTRQKQQAITQTSLKALENSLSFLETLMKDSRYRDAVFEVLTNNFKNDLEIEGTYHALFEFVKVSSPFLGSYQKALIDLTEVHLERRDNTSILNLQLWEIIGSEYADKEATIRQRIGEIQKEENFLQSVSDQLLPNIMKCLLIMNHDQEDDEDLKMSAAKAIESFVKVCDKRVIDCITGAVAKIINSEDPYHQQATVVLFSTICEYPDRLLTVDLFANGFQHLYALLKNSQNKIVVKNSLIGFVRLSESLPEVFLLHRNIEEIISTIFNFVNVDLKDIRYISVQILANISEGLKVNPQPVSDDPKIMLTKVVKFYTDNMLKLHTEQSEVNEKLTAIIMNIVMNTNKRDVIIHLVDFMIEEYYKVANINLPNSEFLIEQVLSVLHTSILAHKNAVPNNEILTKICDLVNFHVKKYGVEAEGLSILGATATTFNKVFESRANNYWSYIQHALDQVNQMTTFKAALSCVGDFARMMQSQFFNSASFVMTKLLGYIKSSLDRDLKLSIINCMGDLVLSMQIYGESFLDEILNISDICFQAVYELTNSEKDIDYIDELKASLIQMYSCVLFAMNSHCKVNRKLYDHFGNLATFIVRTCDKNVHPTVHKDYLKNCLYLIHDSAAFYWNIHQYQDKVREIIGSNQIKQLVKLISRYNDRPEIKQLLNFIDSRKGVV